MFKWEVIRQSDVPRLCEGWVLEALSFKLAQSLLAFQMLSLALQPSFCKTAVGRSIFICRNDYEFFL